MRKFHSNLAFTDLLFNLLTGFVSLFIIALLLINPVAKEGKIDLPIEFMITANWHVDSANDIDLWIKGPDGETVGFARKDAGYMVLNRDDLGNAGDMVTVNGKKQVIKQNNEVIEIRGIVPGEYIVNLHLYRVHLWRKGQSIEKYAEHRPDEAVTVTLVDMKPFSQLAEVEIHLPRVNSEKTAFTFVVDEKGKITEVNTMANVPFVSAIANSLAHGDPYEEENHQ